MKEAIGNLWDTPDQVIVITTNGFVKKNGEAVMGRGCAKQAAIIMPDLPKLLGMHLKSRGNHVVTLRSFGKHAIVSFPVKPVKGKNPVQHMKGKFPDGIVPGWACVAEPAIIMRSARELVAKADEFGWESISLPRPGCGAGELGWETIKGLLTPILDDRFTCWNFK